MALVMLGDYRQGLLGQGQTAAQFDAAADMALIDRLLGLAQVLTPSGDGIRYFQQTDIVQDGAEAELMQLVGLQMQGLSQQQGQHGDIQ